MLIHEFFSHNILHYCEILAAESNKKSKSHATLRSILVCPSMQQPYLGATKRLVYFMKAFGKHNIA